MRRIAAPMVGGLLTSAFLTLEVIPVIYTVWRVRQLRRAERLGVAPSVVVGPPPAWLRASLYRRTVAETEGTPLVSTRNSM
jgi:hypothetical protein